MSFPEDARGRRREGAARAVPMEDEVTSVISTWMYMTVTSSEADGGERSEGVRSGTDGGEQCTDG